MEGNGGNGAHSQFSHGFGGGGALYVPGAGAGATEYAADGGRTVGGIPGGRDGGRT